MVFECQMSKVWKPKTVDNTYTNSYTNRQVCSRKDINPCCNNEDRSLICKKTKFTNLCIDCERKKEGIQEKPVPVGPKYVKDLLRLHSFERKTGQPHFLATCKLFRFRCLSRLSSLLCIGADIVMEFQASPLIEVAKLSHFFQQLQVGLFLV